MAILLKPPGGDVMAQHYICGVAVSHLLKQRYEFYSLRKHIPLAERKWQR